MSDFGFEEGWLLEDIGTNLGTTNGTVLTAGSPANTKAASYTQLIAATARSMRGMIVTLSASNLGRDCLVDVGIGAAASEVALYENILFSTGTDNRNTQRLYLPCDLPAGTRVSARHQCSTASEVVTIQCHGVQGGPLLVSHGGIVTTYGVNTADSGAVQVTSGASGAEGSYAEITASTTRATKMLYIVLGNQARTALTGGGRTMDVAVGAGGSEQPILTDILLGVGTTSDMSEPTVYGPFPVNIPLGTRLAVRASNSGAGTTTYDVALYGIS